MNYKKMQEFWDKKAEIPGAITPAGEKFMNRHIKNILSNISLKNFEKMDVLDIGCGEGRVLKRLASLCKTYTGIDVSKVCLKRTAKIIQAEKLTNCKIKLIKDMDEPFRDLKKTFDFILSFEVFLHCSTEIFINYIKKSYKILNSEGFFLFTLQNRHLEGHKYDEVSDDNLWKGRWYPEEYVINLLGKNGFSLVSIPSKTGNQVWQAKKVK